MHYFNLKVEKVEFHLIRAFDSHIKKQLFCMLTPMLALLLALRSTLFYLCFCHPGSLGKPQDRDGQAGLALTVPSTRGEHVWHYDEELVSGGGSPKPGSLGSLEQGEGAASSGFLAVNLSSGQQDVDSREWVVIERGRDLQDFGSSGTGHPNGIRVSSSPSEEEPEILQPGKDTSSGGRGSTGSVPVPITTSRGGAKVERLDLGMMPPGNLPAVTPTSPAEAMAEGVLTQVRATPMTGATRFSGPVWSSAARSVKYTVEWIQVTYMLLKAFEQSDV